MSSRSFGRPTCAKGQVFVPSTLRNYGIINYLKFYLLEGRINDDKKVSGNTLGLWRMGVEHLEALDNNLRGRPDGC